METVYLNGTLQHNNVFFMPGLCCIVILKIYAIVCLIFEFLNGVIFFFILNRSLQHKLLLHMSSNRRRYFLRTVTLGTGALVTGTPALARVITDESDRLFEEHTATRPGGFNMCGYAAPKMDKVRIGIVGLGMRGPGAVSRFVLY